MRSTHLHFVGGRAGSGVMCVGCWGCCDSVFCCCLLFSSFQCFGDGGSRLTSYGRGGCNRWGLLHCYYRAIIRRVFSGVRWISETIHYGRCFWQSMAASQHYCTGMLGVYPPLCQIYVISYICTTVLSCCDNSERREAARVRGVECSLTRAYATASEALRRRLRFLACTNRVGCRWLLYRALV